MVLQNQLGVAQEYSATGEPVFLSYPLTGDVMHRRRRLGITLSAIRHVVFDVRSPSCHEGARR